MNRMIEVCFLLLFVGAIFLMLGIFCKEECSAAYGLGLIASGIVVRINVKNRDK